MLLSGTNPPPPYCGRHPKLTLFLDVAHYSVHPAKVQKCFTFMWHSREPHLLVVEADEREETLEALLHGDVLN